MKTYSQLSKEAKDALANKIYQLYIVDKHTKTECVSILNISEWTFDHIRQDYNLFIPKEEQYKRNQVRMRAGVLAKYGVSNVNKLPEVVQKRADTMKSRYGASTTMQSSQLRQKWIDRFISRYGVNCPARVEKFKLKQIETFKARYPKGSIKLKNIVKKRQNTCMKRYGAAFPFKDMQKIYDKFGVRYARQCHMKKEVVDIVNSRQNFINAIETLPLKERTLRNISDVYGISYDQVIFWANRYGVRDSIRRPASNLELKLQAWLTAHDIEWQHTREIISPLEIDLYLPQYSIGIEVNGEYWHSLQGGTDPLYHQQKSLRGINKGVCIYHIYEREMVENFDNVTKNILRWITPQKFNCDKNQVTLSLDTDNVVQYLQHGYVLDHTEAPVVIPTLDSNLTLYNAGKAVLKRKYKKVTKVEAIRCKATPVYDIEVPHYHNFVLADGSVVHNSVDMRQQLTTMGFNDVSLVSLDRTPDGYMALRSAIAEKRIALLKLQHLEVELVQLERDNVSGKIDHPVNGAKDGSDGLAGALYNALLHEKDIANDMSDLVDTMVEMNQVIPSTSQIITTQQIENTVDPQKMTKEEIIAEAKRRATIQYGRERVGYRDDDDEPFNPSDGILI